MRTTINLDEDVLARAKHRAVDLGLSLSEFVEHAVRAALAERPREAEAPFRMPVWGDPSKPDPHEPADFWRMIEDDELPGRKR